METGRIRERVNLNGMLIDQIDRVRTLPLLRQFLRDGVTRQVVTVNLDFLAIAARQEQFRETINRADLAVADGMPLIWLSRLLGEPLPERVTGNEIVDQCCGLAAERQSGVFLLGAAPSVAHRAARTLLKRYPGLEIAGVYSPPFGPLGEAENERVLTTIRRAAPEFLFVALGAPRQDFWIAEHRKLLRVPVSMGVGCVLDILAGAVSRAPIWMQQAGLEWTYRLAQEPRRLWRRYLVNDLSRLGPLAINAVEARCRRTQRLVTETGR
jgi:N-acetylglucosaminyldiphosphoundecaprenol N-acetyl-beta-D-mannosaminyltransferase